jgi:hypothetical protein
MNELRHPGVFSFNTMTTPIMLHCDTEMCFLFECLDVNTAQMCDGQSFLVFLTRDDFVDDLDSRVLTAHRASSVETSQNIFFVELRIAGTVIGELQGFSFQ